MAQQASKRKKKKAHIVVRILKILLLVFMLCILAAVAFFFIKVFPDLQSIQQHAYETYQHMSEDDFRLVTDTEIFDKDDQQIGVISSGHHYVYVGSDDISPWLKKAYIAQEDRRFYSHHGVDWLAIARAGLSYVKHRRVTQGGSTITQQVIKNTYLTQERSLKRKFTEMLLAPKLEKRFGKDKILEFYCNGSFYAHGCYGVEAASRYYFDKSAKDLEPWEAAVLVGISNRPATYEPVNHPKNSLRKRNEVLNSLYRQGDITAEQLAEYKEKPLEIAPQTKVAAATENYQTSYAIYCTALQLMKTDGFKFKYTFKNKEEYDKYQAEYRELYADKSEKIRAGGYKIYTTIDSRMQQYAEESVYGHVAKFLQPAFNKANRNKKNAPFSGSLTLSQVRSILNRNMFQSERYRNMKAAGASDAEIRAAFNRPVDMTIFTYHGDIDTVMTPMDSIKYYKGFLRAGFMSMDPKTGAVKAYVGGLDYNHFMYDMVTGGRRQVGSTIKPFLYALAMENGFSPCDLVPNVQKTYMVAGSAWTPRNASHARYGQMVTLKWGLAQSNNWISAYLMSKLNPQQFVSTLHEFGINNPDIHPSMSLCLGPCDVSVAEMVSAYSTFANHGIRTAPMFVSRIEDNEGNVIASFQPRMNEVISVESANKMLVLLQGVVDGGTASRLRYKYHMEGEICGKTGTTNKNSDAWFMGFTPQLVTGIWVGGEDRDIHFDNISMGQGATMALPIWAYFMKKIYRDKSLNYSSNATFELPDGFDPCSKQDADNDEFQIDEVYE